MNKTQSCMFFFLAAFWGCFSAKAQIQLADSIWSGESQITIPAITPCDEGGDPLPYPKTTTNLTLVIPVEVWFWDSSKFLIVYRQGAVGADPSRAFLQPLIGEWNIPVAARTGALNGVPKVTYGSDLYEVQTGSYAKLGTKYTFIAEKKDTDTLSEDDSEWIYPKAQEWVTGSFKIQGQTLSAALTIEQSPNPIGPGGIKITGSKKPSATATLTKTDRKPSTEGVDVFLDGPL